MTEWLAVVVVLQMSLERTTKANPNNEKQRNNISE